MTISSKQKPYVFGALAGLLLTASVGIAGEFFGTSTTFPRASTWLLTTLGVDISGLEFAQASGGSLTGASFPDWQLLFVIGIGVGAFLAARLSGTFKTESMPPMWVETMGSSRGKRIAFSLVGGAVAMIGARMAGGCPSGHGVSGMSQLGLSSLIALTMFFVGGVATARVLYKGGAA